MSTPFDRIAAVQASDDLFDSIAGVDRSVPASVKQRDYLRSLMMEKAARLGLDAAEASAKLDAWLPTLDITHASAHIGFTLNALKSLPKPQAPTAPAVDVPAGRYAVATEDGATNALAFYKVDRPTEGRWAGYTFVKLIVSDDEQRLSRAASQAVLAKIAEAGPAEASALYGHEIGSCGVCGRTLTNDESRARGIGPVCAARVFGL